MLDHGHTRRKPNMARLADGGAEDYSLVRTRYVRLAQHRGKVLRSVLVEPGPTLLACGDVTEEVEVIVEEV